MRRLLLVYGVPAAMLGVRIVGDWGRTGVAVIVPLACIWGLVAAFTVKVAVAAKRTRCRWALEDYGNVPRRRDRSAERPALRMTELRALLVACGARCPTT